MLSQHLKNIEDLGIYPVISLIIFFTFFVLLIIRVVRIDKRFVKQMEMLPLESNTEEKQNREVTQC